MTTNPCTTARDLAAALDSDPIAASQIKEYLSNERLCEILDLKKPEADLDDFTDEELQRELRYRAIHRED